VFAQNIFCSYNNLMNKMPLPIHLLAQIPGYSMLGQTSFGGYFKIITAWWLNDCPEVFLSVEEWGSLSGMFKRDYNKYRTKIEPVLLQSLDVLKKYREEKHQKNQPRLQNIRKAQRIQKEMLAARKLADNSKGNIVDKVTPVNPAPAIPSPKPFHEGWNLERQKSPNINKKTTHRPMLLDK
jgi:hypothetical protein